MANPLTDAAIVALKPKDARYEVPDVKISGLYLVIQPSGAKSWAYRYRAAGVPKKFTIGTYPTVSLKAARAAAQKAAGEVAVGVDPSAKKKAQRASARAARANEDELVENVVKRFVDLYAKRKTRDWKETERILTKDVAEPWRGKRLSTISKVGVNALLQAIVDRGAPIGANRVFAQLRKMCAWAVSQGIIVTSPCDGVEPPSAEVTRDRVLSLDELTLVWKAAASLHKPYDAIIRMLILTAQRRDEVAALPWSELDAALEVWTLSKARAKNRREHVIPIVDAVRDILKACPRVAGSPFVFGGGKAPPQAFSKLKDQLDAKIAELNSGAPIPHWVLHDLRRSAASGMAELGILPHVVEAVLNHRSGLIKGVAAVYNRYSYGAEKRAALELWARIVEALVAGKPAKLVELVAARG